MAETEKPKRRYNYSSKQKAKIAARRAVKRAEAASQVANKEAAKLRAKAHQFKKRADKKKADKRAVQKALENGGMLTDEQLREAPPNVQLAFNDEDIIFSPHDGPQTQFLAAPETEVLYGGAAGGGKSYAMLADPLRYAHNPSMRALLLRKTMPELIELIDISRVMYVKAFPGAKFQEQKGRWLFPSGATLQFSFVDNDKDVFRFMGQAFTWIGVDELGHFATPFVWNYLRSRLRRTDQSIIPYMRATANPGGLGGWWIKKMFVQPSNWNTPFWATDIDTNRTLVFPDIEQVAPELRGKPLFKRRFIPAKLTDNPSLMQSPDYMAMLASLPEVERKRLLEGDWDVSEDSAFPEFRRDLHVIKSFQPPASWTRFRACDYGYVAWAAVLWFAIDYQGVIHVYKELYRKGLDAEKLAERVLEMEADEPRPLSGPLDNESWARRGQVGPTIAETMIQHGTAWQRADKGPGSRLNGKAEVHRMLSHNEEFGHPWLQIHDNCHNLARIMPMLPLDENKIEDVDTKFNEDHLYDALRYGLMSRMKRRSSHPTEVQYMHQVEQYRPSDEVVGY